MKYRDTDISKFCIAPSQTIREAMARIDRNKKGIILVTESNRRLLDTITDGDIRRAVLAGESLDQEVRQVLRRKPSTTPAQPITAPVGADHAELRRVMQENFIRQIPLLDEDDRVVGLVTLDDLLPQQSLPIQAVIMAGGFGTRLHPLTEDIPKPMLPVGDRPLLEYIIEQLRQAGILRVNLTTHYKSEKISSYFGDGRAFGVEINYVPEDRPLGTAGALGLIDDPHEPLLVVNGDILTQVDFRAMLAFHQEHKALLTVGVRKYELNVPYGVIKSEDVFVRSLVEKPALTFFVNAGIYLLEPEVHQYIPTGDQFDMTELIQQLLDGQQPVVSFPILEYWLDIGEHIDYQQAQKDAREGRFSK